MKASVKIEKKDLFIFLLYHMYMRAMGIVYLVVGLLALAGGIWFLVSGNRSGIFLLLIAAVYFVLQPCMLYLKAAQQAKLPVLRKETFYDFSREGIRVSQDETDASTLKWEKIRRFVKFGGEYMIYLDDIHANIVPERTLSCEPQALDALVREMLPKKNRRGIK